MDSFSVDCRLTKDGWLKKWIIGAGTDLASRSSARAFGSALVDPPSKFSLSLLLMSPKPVAAGRHGVLCLSMRFMLLYASKGT